MPAQTPTYDLMLLLDSSVEDEQRAKVLSEVEGILAANGATVESRHDWGTRRTAYEIRHRSDAEYHLLQFTGSPQVPAALERYLRITDGVVRFRVIKLRGLTPVPDLRSATAEAPAPEAAAAPAERL